MSLLLFYDTETTGLPLWDQPSDDPRQPHLVQVAAALVDADTRKEVASINLTVIPEGDIEPGAFEVHGITAEHARACGVSEATAVQVLLELWQQASARVGHVESFDARILRIALKRHNPAMADLWKEGTAICTHKAAKAQNSAGEHGPNTLAAVHQRYLGTTFESAHTACADMRATMAVYWAMKETGHV